jgi:hypothetical protein
MRKIQNCLVYGLVASAIFVLNTGCSGGGGDAHELPPQASKEKILAGKAERAKPLIDMLEQMKPADRNAAANSPRMATKLKDGADDPETKARMDKLGITVN